MPTADEIKHAFSLPPKKAIEFFEGKDLRVSRHWTEVWAHAHAKSFTVAGITHLDILNDVRQSLADAMKSGQSFNSWRNSIESTLEKKGWLKKYHVVNPDSGEVLIKRAQAGNRFKTIYRTNMQSAMMAGRYQEQMDNILMRPYGTYTAVLDNRTRPSHSAMHGMTFRLDDPVWQTFYPPCGFNCRCTVVTSTDRDVARRGTLVYNSKDTDFQKVMQPINKTESRVTTGFTHPGTGKLFLTDPGFNFNPGKVRYIPTLDNYDPSLAKEFVKSSINGRDFEHCFNRFTSSIDTLYKSHPDLSSLDVRKNLTEGFKWPVAMLSAQEAKILKSSSRTLMLSDDTLIKQIIHRKGQSFGVDVYRDIFTKLAQADHFYVSDSNLIYFLKADEEHFYEVIVKATKGGDELYLLSCYRIRTQQTINTMKKLRRFDKEKE